jgi:hypothetical protein
MPTCDATTIEPARHLEPPRVRVGDQRWGGIRAVNQSYSASYVLIPQCFLVAWYAWEESGGSDHEAEPTDANINPSRAVVKCGQKVNWHEDWRLSESMTVRTDCPRCFA